MTHHHSAAPHTTHHRATLAPPLESCSQPLIASLAPALSLSPAMASTPHEQQPNLHLPLAVRQEDLCSSSPALDAYSSLPGSSSSSSSNNNTTTTTPTPTHTSIISTTPKAPLPTPPTRTTRPLALGHPLPQPLRPALPPRAQPVPLKPNGRHKVNTLPPWAKSHDDDDLLFQPTPAYTCSYSPNPARTDSESNSPRLQPSKLTPSKHHASKQKQHLRPADLPLHNLHKLQLGHSLVSSPTSLPDPLFEEEDHDWTITQSTVAPGRSSNEGMRPQLSPLVVGGSSSNGEPGPSTSGGGPSSARRSLYRAMTAPSPVFQRLRPLITINGQKKRATDDSFHEETAAEMDMDIEQGKPPPPLQPPPPPTPPTGRHRLGPHQQPPDDRWWQFTLPTKYRRKVEEYLSRGGQGIGGVVVGHPGDRRMHDSLGGTSPFLPPRVEMVEIDSDRRKILALLKRHASAHSSTRYSSMDSNDPQLDVRLQRYSDALALAEEEARMTAHAGRHPPTDFPLSAFSRKMSLTAAQQQMFDAGDGMMIDAPPPHDDHTGRKTTLEASMMESHHPHMKPGYASSLHTAGSPDPRSRTARLGSYLIHHPTAPLVSRLLNLILTALALAICAAIRKSEIQAHSSGLLGASTVFVLVVAPLALVHNLFAIYCEYFGAPIGIWSVSWKMFHTLSELVFVSLWSAALALTMNDELRSPLRCPSGASASSYTATTTTDATETEALAARLAPLAAAHELSQETLARIVAATQDLILRPSSHPARLTLHQVAHICRLQASLVSIIFAGLALYTLVLVVSLFRIFIKVSRKY
ncbi:hypothetical protein PCANC_19227 [Puccinia coronata f. sp. avenae]|uniref:Uncharacterized protein n=1 Tax=Puccinia coronata f. sp. avenae TaxID=200324 RepID=A0A2N5SK43_9BASI|nr:hypothetical protein PCANC_19227 [Puccinia coronata f. sp. avenae]